MWKLEVKEYRVKEQKYSNFRAGLYNVVLGQCTEALQDKLKSNTGFPNAYQDGIVLLTIIKTLTYTFEERRKLADALHPRGKCYPQDVHHPSAQQFPRWERLLPVDSTRGIQHPSAPRA
jgi:hypothetical protein